MRFEDLEVWQEAPRLVLAICGATQQFPREERLGLAQQLRRAPVSVAANIAAGFKRRTVKEKAQFYGIGQGSMEEVRYHLMLAEHLGYLPGAEPFLADVDRGQRMLHAPVSSLER